MSKGLPDPVRDLAASICLQRLELDPDACGGGAIGYHAIGEPGGCPECMKEAAERIGKVKIASGRMITVVLRELPNGRWHATAVTHGFDGLSFTDSSDPAEAVQHVLEMSSIVPKSGTLKSQWVAQQRLERALGDAIAARKA